MTYGIQDGSQPPSVYVASYRYDTWNWLMRFAYPDGEVLTYGYDSGGNVTSAQGVKCNSHEALGQKGRTVLNTAEIILLSSIIA